MRSEQFSDNDLFAMLARERIDDVVILGECFLERLHVLQRAVCAGFFHSSLGDKYIIELDKGGYLVVNHIDLRIGAQGDAYDCEQSTFTRDLSSARWQ
jgi:hypothetical protein